MNGPGHRAFAACTWLATAPALGFSPSLTLMGLLPAIATSYGVASPDIDNTPTAKRLDAAVPDEALGGGGPLQHRGLAHWVGWPVLAGLAVWPVPGWPGALLLAAVLGWGSHLLADLIFGKAGYGTRAGVPVLLWGWHIGLGIKVGGPLETTITQLLRLGAVVLILHLWGWDAALAEFLRALFAPA